MTVPHRGMALAVAFSTLSLLTACRTDPAKATQLHLARGEGYFSRKEYSAAIIEFRSAALYSPKLGEPHARLAETYARNDDMRSSFQEYLKAADLLPGREDVQITAGNLLLIAGRFQDAKTRARVVLEKNPQSVAAILLLGHALVGLKDYDSAAALGKKVVELDPERSGGYRDLGVIELLRGNADSAEAAFRRALEIDPKSVAACLALADLYRASGARAKAEAVLKHAL